MKGSEKRKAEIFFAVREVIRAYVGVNKSGMARERSFGEGFFRGDVGCEGLCWVGCVRRNWGLLWGIKSVL